MKRRNSNLAKILLSLFAVNSLSFFFYFSSHDRPTPKQGRSVSRHHRHQLPEIQRHRHVYLKPWPTLPSYLPWSQTPRAPPRSCEAYFGNGFTRRLDVLPPAAGVGSGWFRCHYSETLSSSVCEGGKIRMRPERIKMSIGGEGVEEVIGRKEEEELPEFENGAFEVDAGSVEGFRRKERSLMDREFLDRYLPESEILRHTMRELMGSIRVIVSEYVECDKWVEEPTLLVTRYEYANVFHTVTDWYSAYVASRVTGLPQRPHLVFVDGHCMTQLEETWTALFSSIRHAKNFSGSVCFRHAILSPLGYETALFKGLSEGIDCQGAPSQELWQNPDNKKTARLAEFGEMIKAAFDFPPDRHRMQKTFSGHNILFVRREDYLAHPRHKGKVQSRLDNEQEVFDSLKYWTSKYRECKLNLVNGIFAHMPMKEQIRAIQDASIIVGAHGAGLTHMVSAMPKTVILEIISREYRRPHFQLISQWRGLEYHPMYLHESYADPADVINELGKIVRSLGCEKSSVFR